MRSLFWFGMGALGGTIMTVFAVLGMLMALADNGIHVTADLGDYSMYVGRALRDEAALEIPLLLERVEADVARAVSGRMAGALTATGITIYGVEVMLPPDTVTTLEDSINDLLARELADSLSAWPWDDLVETWADRAEQLVAEMVVSDLDTPLEIDFGFHRAIPAIPVYVRLETPSP